MNNYFWPLMKDTITEEDKLKMIEFISSTGRFTNGERCKEFEVQWSRWLGSKHSLFVSSGSTANFLLLAAVKELYDLKEGDKVVVPACTWMTNVAPCIQLGLEPIFCDISLETFAIDTHSLKQISNEHDIKLCFVTHLLGLRAPMERYKEILPNALFIEDICESHGITDEAGVKQGGDSLGATFSFYFGHHMTTIEGGMVSTNNSELYDLMRMKRSHGMARESQKFNQYKEQELEIDPQFLFMTDGYNFRSSELNAVLGINQLKRLDQAIKIRRNNYSKFLEMLPEDRFYVPSWQSLENSSFCLPLVTKRLEDRNKLKAVLEQAGIETRPIIGGNLLKQPFLRDKGYTFVSAYEFPNVEILHNHGCYVGNNHLIGDKELDTLERLLKVL